MNLKPGDKAWLWYEPQTRAGGEKRPILCTVLTVTPKRIRWDRAVTTHEGKGEGYTRFATPEEVRSHVTYRLSCDLHVAVVRGLADATLPQLITIADLLGIAVPAVLRRQED